jgi:hypothetical protein
LNVEDGNDGVDGETGERNFFKKLCERLTKDIEALLTDCARKVLVLDNKKKVKDGNEESELWEAQVSAILNQVDLILDKKDEPNTDKF